jgi:hypothetical protein
MLLKKATRIAIGIATKATIAADAYMSSQVPRKIHKP